MSIYSPPTILEMDGAALPGLGDRPDVCPRLPAVPNALPAVMPKGLTPVIPNGLPLVVPTAVIGRSKLGSMAALLLAVPPRLAGNIMLLPRDKLELAGLAELALPPAMPMKEGKTALLACLLKFMFEPLPDLGDCVSLQENNSFIAGHTEITSAPVVQKNLE